MEAMRLARLALLSLLLVACSQRRGARVAGEDDAEIATQEARLEELRAQGASPTATCADRCALTGQTCGVAESLCEVVARHPQRPELATRCVRAREACASGTDTCARCQARE